MLLAPAPRQQPAGMADEDPCRPGRPATRANQHRFEAFAPAGPAGAEVRAPGVHLGPGYRNPGEPLPAAEVQLRQFGIDAMVPPPSPQPSADVRTAPQRRGHDDARQAMAARFALYASRQSPGAPRVDRQVRAGAHAAPFGPLRLRMAPGQEVVGRKRPVH